MTKHLRTYFADAWNMLDVIRENTGGNSYTTWLVIPVGCCTAPHGCVRVLKNALLISYRVTAEVKHNQTGNVVCKAQGEWNGVLEFTYSNGETKAIDTSKQPIIKKKILPPEKQGPYESR